MIQATNDELLNFLRQHQYEAELQEETNQVYTIFKISNREYPLFLRIVDEGQLLQLLAFIPCPLEKDAITDMARLLHLLNKELDLPGFGMDEMAGVVFYRLMLPTYDKKMDEDLLLSFIKTMEYVCEIFSNPIEAIGHGHLTLDQVLQKIKEIDYER
jgi:hypothetical protein